MFYEFLKGFIIVFMFITCALVNLSKQCYLKHCRCLEITQVHSEYACFYKNLRIWARTESYLELSDFECPDFLTSFLKVPFHNNLHANLMRPLDFSKQCF